MRPKLAIVLLLAFLLTGCGLGFGRRLLNGGSPSVRAGLTPSPTQTATDSPTNTPVPTATLAPTPTLDPQQAGLPSEPSGSDALDFVATMCKAEWFTHGVSALPCPGDENRSSAGFVQSLPGDKQGLTPGFPVLLMYPPQDGSETIFSKYPSFTVQKGDRFRAVLGCRLHTFCDVEFSLEYYNAKGTTGIAHWPYRFTDAPIVVDYPLDGVAGLNVRFGLSLRGVGNRLEAYGVWLFPHIYRPGR